MHEIGIRGQSQDSESVQSLQAAAGSAEEDREEEAIDFCQERNQESSSGRRTKPISVSSRHAYWNSKSKSRIKQAEKRS